jgi:NAD(P)-dependent dehydrogenase (short-subunit alcohol dehydrogenase family)
MNHSLIIGGTRGIGRALVKLLAEEGGAVSVIGCRAPEEPVTNARYWVVDLLDVSAMARTLEESIKQDGKLNSVVFLQRYRGEGDNWAGEIETSLTATKSLIERLSGEFEESGDKAIVLVSSIAAELVVGGQPVGYHVAKAGFNQMIRYYAVALGPKGIRVNGVSPATVLKDESKEFYLNNEKLLALYRRIIPLGRMGTAEDVARVISFLASHQSAFVTGQNIVVDGGLTLQSQESLARGVASL